MFVPANAQLAHVEGAAQAKVNAGRVRIASDSALVITGEGVRLEALDLDGALVIAASPGAPMFRLRGTYKGALS